MLEDYPKVVDLPTINDEFRLKRKIETLEDEKTQLESIAKEYSKSEEKK